MSEKQRPAHGPIGQVWGDNVGHSILLISLRSIEEVLRKGREEIT